MTGKTHTIPIRVYYEDTDAGGVVYHASYLRFAERGRTEFLRACGFDHGQLAQDKGILFVVVSMQIDYRIPARLDDLLTLKTEVIRLGGASMEMQQNVYRDNALITELKVTLVCIDKQFKAVRLPEEVRAAFK